MFCGIQMSLLEQQLRQHVQILTQNYLLTYQHPELHSHSRQLKEYLVKTTNSYFIIIKFLYNFCFQLNLKFLAGDKHTSLFRTLNLESAINMINYYDNLVSSDVEEVKEMKL